MPRRSLVLGLSLAIAAPLAFWGGPASAATVAKSYDFNGDGYPELVVGAPRADVGSVAGAGQVVVLPASKSGLSLDEQRISLATTGVAGDPSAGERFGSVFASADFDRDGFADLAVGRPDRDQQDGDTGAVTVLYGSAKGLVGSRSLDLLEPDGSGYDKGFGTALAAGDFDGDGYPELAVGTPGAYLDSDTGGAVTIFHGGKGGLSRARSSTLHGIDSPDRGDQGFGAGLAVADLDQDGHADLVVGSLGEYPTDVSPGSLSVCYGASKGLSGCTQLDRDVAYTGFDSLAVGNVSGSRRPEVVVGVARAATNPDGGGVVHIVSLSGSRASTTLSRVDLTQDSPGVSGSDEQGDLFGDALVLGDLDHDGFDDLVIGVPGEKSKGHRQAGRVGVVYGASTGYRKTGALSYDQGTKGVPGSVERGDLVGAQVSLLDHDADGHLDLSIGAPGENSSQGAVSTLRGSGRSFTTKKARTITLKALGYPTPGESEHRYFGDALGR